MKKSLWQNDVQSISAPTLQQSMKSDICIIGGGLSGVYTAYLLAKEGYKVVLVEALHDFAEGTTAYSTGKLTVQHNLIYTSLSTEQGRAYYEANRGAIERALSTNPPSVSRATSYLYTASDDGREQLLQEAECYKKIGIPFIATNEIEIATPVKLAIGIENEVQINPVEFTRHFAQLAKKMDAQLFLNTRITNIQPSDNVITTSRGHKIHYKKLILCTHYPIESIKNLYSVKLQVNRSYLSATKCTQLLDGQYLSIDPQSRTIRTALINNQPYFVYGGFAHSAGTVEQTDLYYDSIESELQSQFELPKPEFNWSAQDVMTADQIPYIGQLNSRDETLYIATGFNKWGLSSSLVAGEILLDSIKKIASPALELYSPNRSSFGRQVYFMLQTGGFIGKEFIKGYVTRTSAPRCTHLGCKTRWNESDHTWDCPCHGSRYNEKGEVIEGPAVYPLQFKKSDASP
ncbi:MAG: FAD-dependent oxidoreductase [Solibacillus sp.]|uniref:FAD-dependent oxidoreductase n=1 Tax=unclassified Solibacillus TaxID=2637870 RepID=UPI0030F5327E